MTVGTGVARTVLFLHRWMGVALCGLFLLWFPSGIGMMYWSFPGVTPADRLDHAPPLDPATIHLSPAEAYATLGISEAPTQARLNTFDGRPVYRFRDPDGESLVYADTGDLQIDVSEAMRLRIASAWTGQPTGRAESTAIEDVDQWTVGGGLRTLRPLWKYAWPNGDEVYIAGATGEVVQYTTRRSRIGAYLGPIPHWLYFTPLRKHPVEWGQVVIWTSGVGTIAALLGLVVGVWMYSPNRRYRYRGVPTRMPYRGQKRWHMLLGLVFGLGATTWAFSGMLSMDPFPRQTGGAGGRPSARAGIERALRGSAPLVAFEEKDPRIALQQAGGRRVKELELLAIAGEPVYLATLAGAGSLVIPLDAEPSTAIDHQRILDVVRRAAAPTSVTDIATLEQYDAYYLDRRRERPLPVIRVRLDDGDGTRIYVDPATARVVGTYSASGWVNRWLYHGLHSLDFPWLYNYRPLWDVVVITFMIGGTALCVTSLVLAWRVLGRSLARSLRATARRPVTEDLPLEPDSV